MGIGIMGMFSCFSFFYYFKFMYFYYQATMHQRLSSLYYFVLYLLNIFLLLKVLRPNARSLELFDIKYIYGFQHDKCSPGTTLPLLDEILLTHLRTVYLHTLPTMLK